MKNKRYLIFGIFNKKSIAYHAASVIKHEGAEIVLVVKDNSIREKVKDFFTDTDVFVCNVENDDEIEKLYSDLSKKNYKLDGMLHSIAYANFSEGFKPFHETNKNNFLQAIDISCFSLINISNALKGLFNNLASIVTLSVPFTNIAVENYSYMAPVKAALESSVVYLAKSFSKFSEIRFNVVCAGFLKTSAAAGIPNYLESYLFAEKLTLRKRALEVVEVANVIAFLLSNNSRGINAQTVTVDAGMSINTFDSEIIGYINSK